MASGGGGSEPLKAAIARADLFMRNSGMGTDTNFMADCKKQGKPYGLYGQSYFPAFVEGDRAAEHVALLSDAAYHEGPRWNWRP